MRLGYYSNASNQRYIQLHKSKEIDQTYGDKDIDQIQIEKYIVQIFRAKDRFKFKTPIYSSNIYSPRHIQTHKPERHATTKINNFESG